MSKLSARPTQIREIFMGIEVPLPALISLFDMSNKVSDVIVKANEASMMDNQKQVAKVRRIRGKCTDDLKSEIRAESDVS